ncbi:MAG: AI-2E family transporter [Patescibacteria group bacterium]|nr:AI-2E family transporter [Patescibacteria group bacterium]
MGEFIRFEIGWKTFWQILVFLAFLLILYLARQVMGVLLISIVVSLGLDPIISFLEKKKINRLLGTIAVFLVGLLLLSTAVYFIIPIFILEVGGFLGDFNRVVSEVFGFGLPQSLIQDFSLSLDKALGILTAASVSIGGAISAVFTRIILVLATVVISFYLSVQKGGTEKLLRVILPDVYEKPVLTIFNRFKKKIRHWFAAQLGLSLVVGVVVSVGLWLLGVRYAIVLGVIAAILELVPVIGPVVAGAIASLVAFSASLSLGLYVLGFSFLVQQLENHVLIPVLMGKTMNVHPVIVIISLLTGAQVAGLVGVILAVPIAVAAQEIFNYLAERKDHKPALGI